MYTLEDADEESVLITGLQARQLVEKGLAEYDDETFAYTLTMKCYMLGGWDYLAAEYDIRLHKGAEA